MFENEYIMNRDLTKEYVFKTIGKRMIIIGLIIFVLGILMFFTFNNAIKYVMITCGFVALFTTIATPIVIINNLEAQSKRLNNGKTEKTKLFFDNSIIMDEGKVHFEFEYNQIQEMLETKHFIVLKLGNNSSVLVLKDGFTKGNKNEFMEFIKKKIKGWTLLVKY